jgi:hypothetical protein
MRAMTVIIGRVAVGDDLVASNKEAYATRSDVQIGMRRYAGIDDGDASVHVLAIR